MALDSTYARNLAGARDGGLVTGAYYVIHEAGDARAQAEWVVRTMVDSLATDLPVALDFETGFDRKGNWVSSVSKAKALENAETFAQVYSELTGHIPILYTGAWYMDIVAGKTPTVLGQCPLWVAKYVPRPDPLPHAWSSWVIWQYDGDGGRKLKSGVDCDFNRFNGDILALESWAEVYKGQPTEQAPGSGNWPCDDGGSSG